MAHDFSARMALALPTDFLGQHVFLFVGLGNADRFLHTYLPAERGTVVFDGDRWAMSESGSKATLISHVIGDEVVFAFRSKFPTGHLRPFKENTSVVSGGHSCVHVGKFYFSVNGLNRWPGESSVLSASPAIGELLLYVIQPQALFHSRRDLTRSHLEPLRQFSKLSSAESIVHLPPPVVNHTLPEARQNKLNSEDQTNKEVKISLQNHSDCCID
jgi:hypothetical protein